MAVGITSGFSSAHLLRFDEVLEPHPVVENKYQVNVW